LDNDAIDPIDPIDDVLLDIALAVADRSDLPWQQLRDQLPSRDAAVVEALQAVSRLSLARRAPSEADSFAPSRWGHLNVLSVSRRGEETQFVARDDALGREVVLTLIGPLDGDAVRTEQLLQQARQRTRVSHPNLAAIYGADYAQDRVGYWAERVDGRSLAEIVSSGGRYGVSQACEVVAAIAGAVGALHAAGLSNGGVSPSQIVEAADGRIVLLATICVPAQEDSRRPPCTPETDLFDLGALLVYLLTGIAVERPVDPAALIERVRQARPDVRAPLVAAIERCVSSDAQRRFATTAALETAIRAATSERALTSEWVIGFVVTALVMLLLLWYALVMH
jgi:hypothetical protein